MKNLSVVLIASFISPSIFAASKIISDFELNLPRQFQQLLINKKWETLVSKEFQGNWLFPDQMITSGEAPISLKRVSLKLKTVLEKPQIATAQEEVELISRKLDAELVLGEISLDHIVTKTVGGVVGKFRIQARCQNIVLKLMPESGAFSVRLRPSMGVVAVGASVKDVDFSWAPGSWTFDDPQCEGVEGFSDLLKREIDRINNDSELFMKTNREILRSYLQAYLDKITVDLSGSRQIFSGRSDIRLKMQIQDYQDLKQDGIRTRGVIVIDFLNSPDQEIKYLHLDQERSGDSNQAQVRLPSGFIKEFFDRAYAENSWNHRIFSDQLPGFKSLMHSRFAQFFVWPEMLKFPKSSKFIFDLSSRSNPSLKGEGLSYFIETFLDAKMWAPREDAYVPFMKMNIPFRSHLTFRVAEGNLLVDLKKSFLKISALWEPSYIQNYSPYRRFASTTIRNQVLEGLESRSITFELPKIPIADGLNLKIQAMQVTKKSDLIFVISP